MSIDPARILIVDDDPDAAMLLAELLRRRGHDVYEMSSALECLDWLQHDVADIVITDNRMRGMSGVELCQQLHDRHPDLLSFVISGDDTSGVAIAAMRAGAYDYIVKPVSIDILDVALARALSHLRLRREVKRLHSNVADRVIDGIGGESEAIRRTLGLVRRAAGSDATVLITGESGTGKERIAVALHRLSPRSEEPFVAINCAAMPANLLESELFGHVSGAFTDARVSRPGLFARAGRGTIFLDEIGEMPPEMQVKLLRVIQERKVRAVGSDVETKFEARVLASTHRDLPAEVSNKRFREDLYYRVNVIAITVPPLRDRGGDVLVLARHLLHEIASRTGKRAPVLDQHAARVLLDYDWPGNVRELENCIERAVALCRTDVITAADLPDKLRAYRGSRFVLSAPATMFTLVEMERRYVRQVLCSVGGNKSFAARVLGIDRRSVYRRLSADAEDVTAA